MKSYLLFLTHIIVLVVALACQANGKNPLYVKSNYMEIDYAKNIVEYKENVVAHQDGGFDLYCSNAKIFYATSKASGDKTIGTKEIKQIEFFNGVTLLKDDKIGKGDFAVLYPQRKLILFKGNVAIKDQRGYLEGQMADYDINKGIFKVYSSATTKRTPSPQSRVKIILNSNTGDQIEP